MTDPIARGYEGPVNDVGWVYLHQDAGSATYAVSDLGGSTSWRVTAGGTGDRAVTVAAGRGGAHGVQAQTFESTILNHDSVSSGVRYDLVAMRFDWSAKTVAPVIVKGGYTRALPAAGAGGAYRQVWSESNRVVDVPLALVKLTAGSSVAVVDTDLRVWQADAGVIIAADSLALDVPLQRLGARALVGGNTWWRCYWDGIGGVRWETDMPASGAGMVALGANFAAYAGLDSNVPVWDRDGKWVSLTGQIAPKPAALTAGITGAAAQQAFVLPPPARPLRQSIFRCQGSGEDSWGLQIATNGVVLAGRYGPSTPTTSMWMPFAVTYKATA